MTYDRDRHSRAASRACRPTASTLDYALVTKTTGKTVATILPDMPGIAMREATATDTRVSAL